MITKSITSGERAATAVISEETRFLFSTEWNFFHVKNLGTDTVYISMTAGATAGADGVIAIPTGESACTAHGYTALSVYVTAAVATDKVQVIGSNIADSPFKGGSKGGGGIDGKDGKDGIDGTNGIDGVDGKDGIDGIDGVVTALACTRCYQLVGRCCTIYSNSNRNRFNNNHFCTYFRCGVFSRFGITKRRKFTMGVYLRCIHRRRHIDYNLL